MATAIMNTFCRRRFMFPLLKNVPSTSIESMNPKSYSSKPKTGVYSAYDLIDKLNLSAPTEHNFPHSVFENINTQIAEKTYGRLFAVVMIASKQFKVTQDDLILIQEIIPADPGTKITLDKVLLVGSSTFTAIGRPLLSRDQVKVNASVIEKTFSQQIIHFVSEKRSDFKRMRFYRTARTILRINSISIEDEFKI